MIFQQFNLVPPDGRGLENVLHGTLFRTGTLRAPDRRSGSEADIPAGPSPSLDRLGMRRSRRASAREALSGGQQQRVAHRAGVMQDPKMILADEAHRLARPDVTRRS